FRQKDFPYKEIPERKPSVLVGIRMLFKPQINVTANRVTSIFECAAVGCFHDAGSASCETRYPQLRQALADLVCLLVIWMIFLESRGAKHGNTRSDKVKNPESTDKLHHNPENEPKLKEPAAWSF